MRKLILVAEDDRANYKLMENLLKSRGYDVLEATTGQQSIAATQSHEPDLIILDLRLPDGDGWMAASTIRRDASIRQMPIIAVSVEVTSNDRPRAFEAGCDLYFAKPFDVKQLLDAIERYLGNG